MKRAAIAALTICMAGIFLLAQAPVHYGMVQSTPVFGSFWLNLGPGHSVRVLGAQARYFYAGKPAAINWLKPGTRVEVQGALSFNQIHATEITILALPPARSAAAPAPKIRRAPAPFHAAWPVRPAATKSSTQQAATRPLWHAPATQVHAQNQPKPMLHPLWNARNAAALPKAAPRTQPFSPASAAWTTHAGSVTTSPAASSFKNCKVCFLPQIASIKTSLGQVQFSGGNQAFVPAVVGDRIAIIGSAFGATPGMVEWYYTPPASRPVLVNGRWVYTTPQSEGAGWDTVFLASNALNWTNQEVDFTLPATSFQSGNYQFRLVSATQAMTAPFTITVSCPQPSVFQVAPNPIAPGGYADVLGCDFGPSQGGNVLQISSGAPNLVATQSGYQSGPGLNPTIVSWSPGDIRFALPPATAPGSYSVSVAGPNGAGGAAAPLNVTATASTSAGVNSPAPMVGQVTNGAYATLSSGQYVFMAGGSECNGCAFMITGWEASENTALATYSLTVEIPVSFTGSVNILKWRDHQPIVPDSNAKADFSPDGNAGEWVQAGTATSTSNAGPTPVTIQLDNAGVNYISFEGKTPDGFQYSYLKLNPNYGAYYSIIHAIPAGIVTMDALPYALIYEPPGDQSSSNLDKTVTSTLQYSVGQSNQISNGSTDVQESCWGLSAGMQNLNANFQDCNTQTATSSNTFASGWSGTSLYSTSLQNGWPVGPVNTLIPSGPGPWHAGAGQAGDPWWGEDYWHEPFWYDRVVFLIHPQFAVFLDSVNQTAQFQLLPSSTPDWSEPVPITFLAACAAGLTAPSGAGLPTQSNPCQIGDVSLTRQEALAAANLDPYYASPAGQATDPSSICSNNQCRAQNIGVDNFAENDNLSPITIQSGTTSSTYVDTSNTYASSFTSTQSFKFGAGFTKILGISGSLSQNNSTSSTNGTSVTYQASTLATSSNSSSNSVYLGDWDNQFIPSDHSSAGCSNCHPVLNPVPSGPFGLKIFEDNLFGTFMFTDPNAPPRPTNYSALLGAKLNSLMLRAYHAGYRIQLHPRP